MLFVWLKLTLTMFIIGLDFKVYLCIKEGLEIMKKKAGQASSYSRVSEPKNNQLVPVNNTNKVRVSNSEASKVVPAKAPSRTGSSISKSTANSSQAKSNSKKSSSSKGSSSVKSTARAAKHSHRRRHRAQHLPGPRRTPQHRGYQGGQRRHLQDRGDRATGGG